MPRLLSRPIVNSESVTLADWIKECLDSCKVERGVIIFQKEHLVLEKSALRELWYAPWVKTQTRSPGPLWFVKE